MGRSSTIVCFVCIFAATPVLSQGRPLMVRMPTNAGPRLAMRTTQPAFALRFPRMVMRAGRLGSNMRISAGARRGGSIIDGVGLGLSLASDLATPPNIADGYGSLTQPLVIPGLAPPPCPRPLIIKIGLGLRHAARTKVIYGPSPSCVP